MAEKTHYPQPNKETAKKELTASRTGLMIQIRRKQIIMCTEFVSRSYASRELVENIWAKAAMHFGVYLIAGVFAVMTAQLVWGIILLVGLFL